MNVCEALSLSLHQIALCMLSPPSLASLSFGASPSGISALPFFHITPPAVLSLHPSRCVLLTPEAFVSFDTSPSSLSPYQPLRSSDLLQHSFAFHLPSLNNTLFHLILFFNSSLPPLYHCIKFLLLFWLTSLGIFYHFSPLASLLDRFFILLVFH